MFSVCPHLGGGGYPGQVQTGDGVPHPALDVGVPQPGPDGGGGVTQPGMGYQMIKW